MSVLCSFCLLVGHLSFCVGSETHFQRITKALGRSTDGRLVNAHRLLPLTAGHPRSPSSNTASTLAAFPSTSPTAHSNGRLCFVKAPDWELHPVTLIPPPHRGKGTHHIFIDQCTKLSIRMLDQIGIKPAVYLDADIVVRRNLDELWGPPFEFGAVPDIWVDESGFTAGFNAGILFFYPSTRIPEDMVSKLETADFRLKDAEQSYLNHYFGAETFWLPYAPGGNLAIMGLSAEMWKAMQSDIGILHYTAFMPFDFEMKCPDGVCD